MSAHNDTCNLILDTCSDLPHEIVDSHCNLLLDSCSDLPQEVMQEAGIEFFRFPYVLGDDEFLDDLGASMPAKEFYGRLRKGESASTSQLSYPLLLETFEKAAEVGVPTTYIAFTGGLSGSFETAERAQHEVLERHPGFELYVVDSMLACVPEGLLAFEAIRQRDRGLSAAELAKWAEEARWYVHTCFTIDELEHLRRGGRIPDMAAVAGTKLDVKPIMDFNLDGTLRLCGAARGRKKSLRALVKAYQDDHTESGASDVVMIGSADADEAAGWVEQHLDRPEGSLPPLRCNVGPVIGSHVGPGMVVITFWGADRRKNISLADRIANKLK